MRSLIIGRFQPFHLGHIFLLKKALKVSDQVIIVIGSAQDNFLKNNPLTAGERYEMILNAIKEEKIDIKKIIIIPVCDIHNFALWPRHIEVICPKFDSIFTGSKIIKKLFENYSSNYKINFFEEKKYIKISATEIRNKIINKDNSWKNCVNKTVYEFLENIDFCERLRSI